MILALHHLFNLSLAMFCLTVKPSFLLQIVSQCNEAARNMERKTEMKKLASQLEFAKNVTPFDIINSDSSRWLVRSGSLTHMTLRTDETILTTFGKRFNKTSLHLFLFNDLLVVTKPKRYVFLI